MQVAAHQWHSGPQRWSAVNRPRFRTSASNFAMLCIFRGPAAFRPLFGMRQSSSIRHYYPHPRYLNRWFSHSSQQLAGPKRYTPEQLAAFTNYYAILGLDKEATGEDIKKAYNHLCKRFHPDMIRNADSKEYRDNPDRPDFVKIQDAKDFLLDPSRRKAYDATYDDILQAVKRHLAKRREAQGVDPKKAIVSNLRLDQPTTREDGSPIQSHCVVQIAGLPPQVTAVDLVRAIAEIGPVGRVIDTRPMTPNTVRPNRGAVVEFANDVCAQRFGLLACRSPFYVLRTRVWHCKLIPFHERNGPAPPEATRVLVIDGPRDHKLMTGSALGEFLGREVKCFDEKVDSCRMMGSETGPNSVTIELAFTTWRRGARIALAALRRQYPELSVSYGRDPCE